VTNGDDKNIGDSDPQNLILCVNKVSVKSNASQKDIKLPIRNSPIRSHDQREGTCGQNEWVLSAILYLFETRLTLLSCDWLNKIQPFPDHHSIK